MEQKHGNRTIEGTKIERLKNILGQMHRKE